MVLYLYLAPCSGCNSILMLLCNETLFVKDPAVSEKSLSQVVLTKILTVFTIYFHGSHLGAAILDASSQ